MLSSVSRASVKSTRLAPATGSPTGMPAASVSRLRLLPPLAQSVGLGPVFSLRAGAFDKLRPWTASSSRSRRMRRSIAASGPTPSRRPVPRSTPETADAPKSSNRCRRPQRVPLTTRSQHEQNRLHRIAIGHPRVVATPRTPGPRRQQGFDLCPQLVLDPPAIIVCNESHAARVHPERARGKVLRIER